MYYVRDFIIVLGFISDLNSTYETVQHYYCDKGFVLSGLNNASCLHNGMWSSDIPSCEPITCIIPEEIPNGNVTFTSVKFGATAAYVCDDGYDIIGPSNVTCGANGNWSDSPPICQRTRCQELPDIENGNLEYTGIYAGSQALYSCVKGYELFGKALVYCGNDGSWSSLPPYCQQIDCSSPGLEVTHGVLEYNSTSHGSFAIVKCDTGYSIANNQLYCGDEGLWLCTNEGIPSVCSNILCSPITCGPPVITNSTIVDHPNGFLYNSTMYYSCKYGYRLYGNGSRVCQADGTWSDPEPYCELVICPDIEVGNNIELAKTNGSYKLDEVVIFSCLKGFQLLGANQSQCKIDGRWSNPTPACLPISCGQPNNISNGLVSYINVTYNSEVVYKCNSGYVLLLIY